MSVLNLAVLILGPAISTTLIVALIFNSGSFRLNTLLRGLSLNPDTGLVKQPLFWWSILTPVIYFVVFGFFSWREYEISISTEGFKKFIDISTLPLALLSLAIPLGVTIARFHSTEQTARQIFITKHKNNMDAFYSHRKEFFAYFDKIGTIKFLDTLEAKYQINPKLHGLIFHGKPDTGTPELNGQLISELVGKIKSVRISLDKVLRNLDPELTLTWYTSAARDIYWISLTLGIDEIYHELNNLSVTLTGQYDDGTPMRQRSIGTTTVEAISAYRCAKSYILTILHFSGDKESIDEIYDGEISHIDTTGAYLRINTNGLVIERNFAGESETPWNVDR